jgi:hypothetical protein
VPEQFIWPGPQLRTQAPCEQVVPAAHYQLEQIGMNVSYSVSTGSTIAVVGLQVYARARAVYLTRTAAENTGTLRTSSASSTLVVRKCHAIISYNVPTSSTIVVISLQI